MFPDYESFKEFQENFDPDKLPEPLRSEWKEMPDTVQGMLMDKIKDMTEEDFQHFAQFCEASGKAAQKTRESIENEDEGGGNDSYNVELDQRCFYTGIWYAEGGTRRKSDNALAMNFMLIQWFEPDGHIEMRWRVHHFDESDPPEGRQSWHGMSAPKGEKSEKTPEEAYEEMGKMHKEMQVMWNELCERDRAADRAADREGEEWKGEPDDDYEPMRNHHVKLMCNGDEVMDRLIKDAPWYPIVDPWKLACKNELR